LRAQYETVVESGEDRERDMENKWWSEFDRDRLWIGGKKYDMGQV